MMETRLEQLTALLGNTLGDSTHEQLVHELADPASDTSKILEGFQSRIRNLLDEVDMGFVISVAGDEFGRIEEITRRFRERQAIQGDENVK